MHQQTISRPYSRLHLMNFQCWWFYLHVEVRFTWSDLDEKSQARSALCDAASYRTSLDCVYLSIDIPWSHHTFHLVIRGVAHTPTLANSHRLTPVSPSSLPPTKTSRGVKLCIATQVDLLKITRCERTTLWLASINLIKLKTLPRDAKSICSTAEVISSFPAAQRCALGCCQTMVSHQFRAERITSYHHVESADL